MLFNIFTKIFLLNLKMLYAFFSYSEQLRWEWFLRKLNVEVHKKFRHILCVVVFSFFLRIDGDSFEEMILVMLRAHPKPIAWTHYIDVLMSIDLLWTKKMVIIYIHTSILLYASESKSGKNPCSHEMKWNITKRNSKWNHLSCLIFYSCD